MRPNYTDAIRQEISPIGGGNGVSTPVNESFKRLLQAITQVEGYKYGLAQLAFEGLSRVIEDRYLMDDGREDYMLKLSELDEDGSARDLLNILTTTRQSHEH